MKELTFLFATVFNLFTFGGVFVGTDDVWWWCL